MRNTPNASCSLTAESIRELFNASPNIPPAITEYLCNALKNNSREKFLEALCSQNQQNTVQGVDRLFYKASQITQLEGTTLLKKLDFSSNDTADGRIDAVMATLRAIVWLKDLGFDHIGPIITGDERLADLHAEKDSIRYVIEVFCSILKANRNTEELKYKFISNALDKKEQLDNASKKFGVPRKILICVYDANNYADAIATDDNYEKLLKEVFQSLNWGSEYYFGILTGRSYVGTIEGLVISGSGNALYPPI